MQMSEIRLFKKWFWILFISWVVIICGSFTWNSYQTWLFMIDQGRSEGRMAFMKDLSYRAWNSNHGGVYVQVSADSQPNPYLKVPNRDVVTSTGQQLTLINPAYMTRKVFTLTEKIYGIKGHITSLNLMNPNNAPDDWERQSLNNFETDQSESTKFMNIEGKPFLRFMRPMIIKKSCLKCHGHMGYKVGDIRGGISVSVPMSVHIANAKQTILNFAIGHLLFLLMGSILLFFSKKYVMNYLKAKIHYETKLFSLQNYLSNIIDSMPSVLVGVDTAGRVTQWNRTAVEITEINAEDARGRLLSEVFPRMKPEMEKILDSINTKEVIRETKKPYSLDNRIIYENFTVYPLIANGVKGAVVRVDDVTKEYELEQQLAQSRKMDAIGQLAGGVAHDFNNMLGGIVGAAELLKLKIPASDKKYHKLVEMIMQAANRASDLTRKLLEFGRKGKIISTAINIHSIIHDSVELLKRTVDKKVELLMDLKAESDTIVGDKTGLENIFINMGINSSHAVSGGGKIIFETKNLFLSEAYCSESRFDIQPGLFIQIEIRDTGCGIPMENIEKIFEPFYTTKEQGKGTGLGLSAAYGMVQDHCGAINVYSEIDEGTVFHILLPCSEMHSKILEAEKDVIGGIGMVLLVDDELFIRTTGKLALIEMGYEVLLAENGEEAVEIFKNNHKKIDIIIMDMIMPVMNGYEAFYKLREIDKECKIIISSGFTKGDRVNVMQKSGLSGFIRKPYKNYELSKLLAEVLAKKSN